MKVALLALILSVYCSAQTAQITGRVSDASGAVVPSTSVTATNIDTGFERQTSSNIDGYYALPLLQPGKYRLRVAKEGFRPVVREGLVLAVDQIARIDLALEVGTVTESVEISAEVPLVNLSDATVGKVIENRRISDLPLNGRNVLSLVLLTPGVKSNAGPTNSGFGDRGIALSSVSINGSPSGMNAYVLDGNNNNEAYQGGVSINPAVDSVEEFKVQSNTMPADQGFTAGGVVNIVTKSGTNNLRGTLYEFLRNDKFDARNAFAVRRAPFRYNQFGGAVGGPIALPRIYSGKDRTFFFVNYEEWRFRRYDNPIFSVPIAEQRAGDFSNLRDAQGNLIPIYDPATTRPNPNGTGVIRDRFPGNSIPSNRIDPIARNILPFYPLPNRAPTNVFSNSNNYISSNAEKRSMRQYTGRIDQRISNSNTVFGRYSYYKHFTDGGIGGVLPDPVVRQRLDDWTNRNFVLADTHTINPSLLNDLRLGLTRLYFTFVSGSYGGDWPSKLGLPPIVPGYTFPAISNGLPAFRTGEAGERTSTLWQLTDTLTWIRGGHTFKTGATFRINRTNNFQRSAASGSFTFPAGLTGNPQSQAGTGSAFATFLLGEVGSANINTALGQAQHGYSLSFFAQDDWKVTPRLTLNLGLRYDYQPWPVERYNRLSNFDPFEVAADTGLLGRTEYAGIDYGRAAIENDKNDFGPRIGFAYDLAGNGKTVFRGGYGIFYPLVFARDYFGNGAGFTSTSTSYLPPGGNANYRSFLLREGFPTRPLEPLGAALGPSGFLGQNVAWEQGSEEVPMAQQWNFSIQQALGRQWLVEATYSGSRGSHYLSGNYDYNQLDPQYYALGLALQNQVPNPYAGRVPGALGNPTITREQSLRPYPYYNQILVRNPHGGSSIYHALLLTLEKRFSSGLVLLGSYTAGKLISDSVRTLFDFGDTVEQVNEVGFQNGKYDRRAERSLDPTDVAQRFVFSTVYELPFGRGKAMAPSNGLVNALIGGWQVNSITTIQTGLPIIVRGATNFLANRPNSDGRSAKLDDRNATRWFDTTAFVNPPNYTFGNVGRVLPDVRTPGVINVDFSLIKNTAITEKQALEFRAEAFNVANHVNLGAPNASFSAGADGRNRSATFGTITSARDARIIQLGLKLRF